MFYKSKFVLLTILIFAMVAPDQASLYSQTTKPKPKPEQKMSKQSVLLKPWIGPYGGVPPWRMVNPDEFLDAFDVAIQNATEEIQGIADNPEPPTFENTLVALEKSGEMLNRVRTIFGVHSGNLNVGPIPDIESAVAPKLSKFGDSITQNEKLFKRIEAIFESQADHDYSVAQKRLIKDRYDSFVRRGARLDSKQKEKLSQLNAALAGMFADFNQRILREEAGHVTFIDDESRLSGLPESTIDAMAEAAKELASSSDESAESAGSGKWAVTNTRSSMAPFLTYADDRELRELVWRKYYARGDNGGENDTKELISAILKLRAERAILLGYETHAHWRMEPTMAKTPDAAMELMLQVWAKAVVRVSEEVADMQKIADQENAGITIEPWDYRYYAEKVRIAKYDLDFNEVKPYMQLDKLRDAMFWVAGELFSLEFKQVHDVPVFEPTVTAWQVTRDGEHVGLWIFDPLARRGKRSGAWMNAYRIQQNIDESISPIVSNNSNFIKGKPGEPVLISWDDATTLFHEFGHALHGLCSNAKYPSQAGTSVARDYVEFPSQLLEHWLSTPEVLGKFALHFETGEPMPQELLDKIEKAATFNQGFSTVEFLASALIDMKLHLAGNVKIDPEKFEKETLAEIGMPKEIVMRHRTPQFSHIFSSDGYSAGYYSYLWADALTADAANVFEEAGTYYDREIAQRLFDNVFSVGDTIDPAEGFRAFRGRDVDTKALLLKRGLPVD